ncbi:hypothetical protein BDR06DRAFT_554264 [Suillus hirtellus]|nr:hypothetical protein BDR06DRAFT_554264 [Suillus hirtellus]
MSLLPRSFATGLTVPCSSLLIAPTSLSFRTGHNSKAFKYRFPRERELLTIDYLNHMFNLHLFSLDPHHHRPPLKSLLQQPSNLDYTSYQPGGLLVQVMHHRLLSSLLSRRVKRCAGFIFSLYYTIYGSICSATLQRVLPKRIKTTYPTKNMFLLVLPHPIPIHSNHLQQRRLPPKSMEAVDCVGVSKPRARSRYVVA